MLKVGILSPFKKVGKTTISIGLSSKLASKGSKVLFFNFDSFLTQDNFWDLNTKFKIKDYLNKKINLNEIIFPIHKLNFDLISFYKSDYNWLRSSLKNNLSTTINKILLDLEKQKNKYDFCLFDFNNDFELINNFFIKKLDYYIFIIDPKFYSLEIATSLLNYLKIYKKYNSSKNENSFFMIFSMFEKNNIEINKKVEEIKFIFEDYLLLEKIPKINKKEIIKEKLNEENEFIKINKKLNSVYDFFIKNIFNI